MEHEFDYQGTRVLITWTGAGEDAKIYKVIDSFSHRMTMSFSADPLLVEVIRLAQRVKDLEEVVAERGHGTPAPAEIDREAFQALEPIDRYLAYREAAGWALQARYWETEKGKERERVRALTEENATLRKENLTLLNALEQEGARIEAMGIELSVARRQFENL
jgi:hypothetical protein